MGKILITMLDDKDEVIFDDFVIIRRLCLFVWSKTYDLKVAYKWHKKYGKNM